MDLYLSFIEILLVVATLTLAVFYLKPKKDPRYPPGPRPLPLVGNLLQLGTYPIKTFAKWAKEYGPVFSIKMGSEDAVIITDYKLVKELFSENVSSGRSTNPIVTEFSGGSYGVLMNEGSHWEAQRRFTIRKLRDFGFAKASLEGMILEEVSSILTYFERTAGTPFNPSGVFNGAVVNTLWNIVSGERNDWDSDKPPEIIKKTGAVLHAINWTANSGLFFAPWLRYIAPGFFGWTGYLDSLKDFSEILLLTISKHISSLVPSSPRDFIDHFLIEMKESKDSKSSFFKDTGEKNLLATVGDLFLAGSETTANTLVWAFLYLSNHNIIQKKVQEEVDRVIGSSRLPSASDRPLMPYTEAMIMEVLRYSSFTPVGTPHKMLQDYVFKGYFLPKGTTIMANQQGIHHDENVWGNDVSIFKPERFLTEDKTGVIRHEALIPFSVGKRQCIGEPLARDTLFLFLASILQKFNVEPDPDCESVDFDPLPGLVSFPKPFKVVLKVRNTP